LNNIEKMDNFWKPYDLPQLILKTPPKRLVDLIKVHQIINILYILIYVYEH
jgi:hypothetical protein